MFACMVWLVAVTLSCSLEIWRARNWQAVWPFGVSAALPALLTLISQPVLKREWAQLLVLLSWTALAISACVAIGFWPMAVLFLCAPIVASMLDRGKVVEAICLGAIFSGLLYLAGHMGYLRESIVSENQTLWASRSIMGGMGAFILTVLWRSANTLDKRSVAGGVFDYDISNLTHFLQATPGGIIHINKKDQIVFASTEARILLNITHGINAKTPLSDVFANLSDMSENLQRFVADVRGTQDGLAQSFSYLDPQGLPKVLDFRGVKGEKNVIILHAMDVSHRANTIDNLLHEKMSFQQNMDDKALFFSGVSHELRTPLNAIIGFSDMMRSRLFGPLPSKYAEYADLIHDSGQHMLDLIGDVLDISKVNAGKYELHYDTFDIADVIGSTVKMVRPAADAAEVIVKVDVSEDEDLLVEADRKAIRQILLNLLSNSIKFTPKGGQVFVSAKVITETLHLMVSDNGAGMGEDELQRIGQPFVQASSAQVTQERGSGLGLALVKSLTNLHGGRFAIASQKGTGTSVDIYIPLDRKNEIVD
ncbi:MAG: sensor histidine kinase [Maricaulaceae bacterium]